MKSPKEGINPPFTPDWKAYEHIVKAYEHFAEQHCAVVFEATERAGANAPPPPKAVQFNA